MSTYGAAQLAASFRTVRKNTIQIAEDIPEDQYGFVSAPGVRTVAQLLVHIAVGPRIWQAINKAELTTLEGFDFMTLFMGNAAEEQTPRTKAEVVELLRTEGENFASFLGGLSDEFLAVEVGHPGGQPPKSRLEGVMGAKEHEMHHRAQLMVCQRLIGVVPHLTRARQARMATPATKN